MPFEKQRIDVGDGLLLAVRIYRGGAKIPVICIPGLTRNAGDFEDSASLFAETGRDVIVVSLRGRGASDRDPNHLNYHPLTYRRDVLKTLDTLGRARAVFVGTSLGGIVTMLTKESSPDRVAAAVINDVGPELAPEGLARIAGYVGASTDPAETIEEAAKRIKEINAVAFPDASEEDWIKFAKRTFRQRKDGKWELDYDPKIAEALAENGPAPDLWPGFAALKDTPTLVIRGALSDLLSREIVATMRAIHPSFEYVEVPRVGHAPMLTEAVASNAIKSFLDRID